MSSMIIIIELPDGGTVELIESNCRYWMGFCKYHDYEGPIEYLPTSVIEYLIKIKAIK